jgi:two-component system response regulator AtoC
MSARSKGQILVADDEPNLRRVLRAQLERDGWEVHTAEDGDVAWQMLKDHHIDVVISDLRMPGLDGMALLERMVQGHRDVPLIMITAHGTVDTAVEALKLGAFDYVTKPFDRDELKHVIDKAARTRELRIAEPTVDPDERGRYRIIGDSPAMHEVYSIIERVADTPSTVLITGESGTGKELIAEALHENSRRKPKPFIRVNCAAIPAELLESELFGYEKGAFTGAVTSKPGRFELADEGTLFLDEIAEIPPSMQVKLLRVLQEQTFERVGGVKTTEVDVRMVAATNRDLAQAIEEGTFREDLYYRLNVVHLHLPPLRERRRDIPLLVDHFVAKLNARLNREIEGFAPAALAKLQAHQWRGNIRELENVVERCVLFTDGPVVTEAHLPPELRDGADGSGRSSAVAMLEQSQTDPEAGLKDVVKEATARLEREMIVRALDQTDGNVTHAARLLKISRKSLQTKMKELGLRDE